MDLFYIVCLHFSFSIVIWGILTQRKPYQGKAHDAADKVLFVSDVCFSLVGRPIQTKLKIIQTFSPVVDKLKLVGQSTEFLILYLTRIN